MTDEINVVLPPEGRAMWEAANKQYGGISVIDEFLNGGPLGRDSRMYEPLSERALRLP